MSHTVIPPDHPKFPAIKRHIFVSWLKTLAGYAAMGFLIFLSLWGFGFSYEFKLSFGLLWMLLPVVM